MKCLLIKFGLLLSLIGTAPYSVGNQPPAIRISGAENFSLQIISIDSYAQGDTGICVKVRMQPKLYNIKVTGPSRSNNFHMKHIGSNKKVKLELSWQETNQYVGGNKLKPDQLKGPYVGRRNQCDPFNAYLFARVYSNNYLKKPAGSYYGTYNLEFSLP